MPKSTRLTVLDVRTLLQEKAPPKDPSDPLTVTNSVLLHAYERIMYLEHVIAQQSRALTQIIQGMQSEGDGDTSEDAVVAAAGGNVTGPIGGAGSVPSGSGRAPDNTPFPAGVPAQGPPGAGNRTTVISQNANPTGPMPDDAP